MGNDNELMEVSNYEAYLKNFRAVYNSMTAKSECKSKLFSGKIRVNREDIVELNRQITEKLKNHFEDTGFSINVVVKFRDRDIIEFPDWASFEEYNCVESTPIQSITLYWEYYIKLPKYQVPQKHALVVKISDGIRPEEVLNLVFAGKLENFEEIEKEICPLVARVDFIDYTLGDELLNIVDRWQQGVQLANEEVGWEKFFKKNKRKLAYLLHYITLIVAAVCGFVIIQQKLILSEAATLADLTISQTCALMWYILFIAIAWATVYKLSDFLSNVFYGVLARDREKHAFDISRGDKNLQQQNATAVTRTKKRIFLSILGTIILNVACGLITNWIAGI